MNNEIKNSGLADMYKISANDSDHPFSDYVGKKVRYKKELLTEKFLSRHGKIVQMKDFEIRETQYTCYERPVIRGYFPGDRFGRCIDPKDVEIVK